MEILLFGITRDIIGQEKLNLADAGHLRNVGELRGWLADQYPALGRLSSLAVAVDNEYADNDAVLHTGSEIALIPPVSGG